MSGITSSAFVRATLAEAKAPPKSFVGPWAWMRTHLFGSVFDAGLTLLGFYLLVMLVWQVVDFALLRAVWSAENGEACRAEGVGACWPYVQAYWKQFVYGRYPADERWRATLVFILFSATLIPLAMPKVPFKRLNAFAFLVAMQIGRAHV
jgi:general L-amino acid transport system permease protein